MAARIHAASTGNRRGVMVDVIAPQSTGFEALCASR
jgi:hypothetical protein